MKTTTILAVVLGVLVLISVIQAFQLFSVKGALNEGNVKLGSGGASSGVVVGNTPGGNVPSGPEGLPTMVGGC